MKRYLITTCFILLACSVHTASYGAITNIDVYGYVQANAFDVSGVEEDTCSGLGSCSMDVSQVGTGSVNYARATQIYDISFSGVDDILSISASGQTRAFNEASAVSSLNLLFLLSGQAYDAFATFSVSGPGATLKFTGPAGFSVDFSGIGITYSDVLEPGWYTLSGYVIDSPNSLFLIDLDVSPTVVPIPGAIWLLGSGLIGIIGIRRKFKK